MTSELFFFKRDLMVSSKTFFFFFFFAIYVHDLPVWEIMFLIGFIVKTLKMSDQ